MSEWLTVEEIATQLKISRWTVRQWLRSGKLKGQLIGGRKAGWRIPSSEVQRILRGEIDWQSTEAERGDA